MQSPQTSELFMLIPRSGRQCSFGVEILFGPGTLNTNPPIVLPVGHKVS
jgi:hypothetical protein